VNERKPWRPQIKEEPMLNPFESPTDWTRDLGANDRIEVPDEEEEEEAEPGDDEPRAPKESPK
jgi:hypothetical protein